MLEQEWLVEVLQREMGEVGGTADWGDWLHDLFIAQGAVSGSDVRRLASAQQQAVVEVAARRVTEDVTRTTGQAIAIAPVVHDYRVRIACDGAFSDNDSGGFFSIGEVEALCEVADTVQDILVERWWTAWPLCPQHDYGLHPDIIGREAVWLCRLGRHYTPVGRLGEERDGA